MNIDSTFRHSKYAAISMGERFQNLPSISQICSVDLFQNSSVIRCLQILLLIYLFEFRIITGMQLLAMKSFVSLRNFEMQMKPGLCDFLNMLLESDPIKQLKLNIQTLQSNLNFTYFWCLQVYSIMVLLQVATSSFRIFCLLLSQKTENQRNEKQQLQLGMNLNTSPSTFYYIYCKPFKRYDQD